LLRQADYFFPHSFNRSWGSSVSTVSDYWLGGRGIPDREKGFLLYPLRADHLWSPSKLLSNGYWRILSLGVKRGQGVTLTTHSH
jgi:hypothetical protein